MSNLYNQNVETSLLSVLFTFKQCAEYIDEIELEWFSDSAKPLFSVFKSIHSKGMLIDEVTLKAEVENNPILSARFNDDYLISITMASGFPNAIESYISILQTLSVKRKALELSKTIEKLASIPDYESQQLVDAVHGAAQELDSGRKSNSGDTLYNCMVNAYQNINNRYELYKHDLPLDNGIKTGITEIDNKISYVGKNDLVLIGARPSMGKTTLVQTLIENIAINQKTPVLFMSAEMAKVDIADRMFSCVGQVPLANIRSGDIEEYAQQMFAAVTTVGEAQIYIDDMSKPTVFDVRRAIRKTIAQFGSIGAVFIDYLQIMKSHSKSEREDVKLGAISWELKALAKEFNCPIFALSQLNRNLENRPNKRPVNADLRESGSLEQDADIIIMLYRDEVYIKDSKWKGIAEAIITKCRNGATGTAYMASRLSVCRFDDVAPDYISELKESA